MPDRDVVSVMALVSLMAVSIAPVDGEVSDDMPGLPVSVPAPPAVPASRLAPPPHAASAKAVMEPRIQEVRFMWMFPFEGGDVLRTARG